MSNSISLRVVPTVDFFFARHPKTISPGRILWLTDTYGDHNGVSMVLQAVHKEIKERNLPIDIMVCSNILEADDHLLVVKPIMHFKLPFYQQQPFRVPYYLQINSIFRKNKYDHIICSTEGPMSLAAIFLKKFYKVKTFFYLHTDWMMFGKQVLGLKARGLKKVERLMRYYYKLYDGIFVLNTDQQKWLTGNKMRFSTDKVFLTAHWTDAIFRREKPGENQAKEKNCPVILFAGRLSPEKGIFELAELYRKVKLKIPDIKMIIAGTGPSDQALKEAFPEAEYLGWIEHSRLPEIYASADLLILPSRFDTFSCVVLEALSCGVPVIAYNTKGPKDIIQESVNGFLVETQVEMQNRIIEYFRDNSLQESLKKAALKRAEDYTADKILGQMFQDLNFHFSNTIFTHEISGT